MAKKGTKKPPKIVKSDPFKLVRRELQNRSKEELIEIMMTMVGRNHEAVRWLGDQLQIQWGIKNLVENIAMAISQATDFDERMMNHNF